MKEAGTIAQDDVIKALDHARIAEGPGGPAEMVPGQHHVRMNMYIAQANNGNFKIVKSLGVIDPKEGDVPRVGEYARMSAGDDGTKRPASEWPFRACSRVEFRPIRGRVTVLPQAERAYFVIADISGYTGYLAGVELDHAQDIISDLMDMVVKCLRPPFRLAKFEGDAAFFCAAP